uniref:GBD/FH3 domain-containing protein n=1 Tax=Taenia asiatica TaxID=60517 RepID=A0A0R3W330_TAEAS
LFNIRILFVLVGKAIAEKDSKRIIHFNEVRECFLSFEIPPERQAQMMIKELSSTLKTPKKTLHLINLILMLFNHCQPGFSYALTEPKSIEGLLACFVLCKVRSNAAKKLAWLIKLLTSSSGSLSEKLTCPEEVNVVGLDTFCQDSWVPEMTLDDYYELERSIVSKHTDLNTLYNIVKSVDQSDDIKVLEKQRSVVKEMQHRLTLDEHFLQEVRNSFCVPEWPTTGITELLKHIEDALVTIDSLLVSSLPRLILSFSLCVVLENAALRSTSGSVATSATIPYGGSSFNVLRQQYTAAKDFQTRLVKDMEELRDLQRQCCPTAPPEEPLNHLLLQTETVLTNIKSLLRTELGVEFVSILRCLDGPLLLLLLLLFHVTASSFYSLQMALLYDPLVN